MLFLNRQLLNIQRSIGNRLPNLPFKPLSYPGNCNARRNLDYARRLRYTHPKLCMSILIDVLDDLLKRSSPENWRGQPSRDLEGRIKYDEFMIQHIRKCENFTIGQKLKLVHQLGLDLEKTDTKLCNRHECECCGIILHVSNRIGPECAKHPDKFPCNAHRGRIDRA